MIKQVLEKQGYKVGLIGTIANYIGTKCLGESQRTTPDSLTLQRMFSQMVNEKVDCVVMEVSSQSLKLNRVDGCYFDIAVFTNFQKTTLAKRTSRYERLFSLKLKLFEMCKTGFINADDLYVSKITKNDAR